jgi:hypothetical protein
MENSFRVVLNDWATMTAEIMAAGDGESMSRR